MPGRDVFKYRPARKRHLRWRVPVGHVQPCWCDVMQPVWTPWPNVSCQPAGQPPPTRPRTCLVPWLTGSVPQWICAWCLGRGLRSQCSLPVLAVRAIRCSCARCRCPVGTESRGVGQSQCEPCRLGMFRDGTVEACADCETAVAINTVTLDRGSPSRTRCVCKSGYYAQWNVSEGTPAGRRLGELCAPCPSTTTNCSIAGGCTSSFGVAPPATSF
jgi:hypothetical protein